MDRPAGVLRGVVIATRQQLSVLGRQSERTLLLGIVMVASALSVLSAFVLAQCYQVDVATTLINGGSDCWFDWETKIGIGQHCFSDYYVVVYESMRPNPWDALELQGPWQPHLTDYNPYPAAGKALHMVFGLPAEWLHAPRAGMVTYLLALTVSVFSPAIWAARGARGLERIVVFLALSAAAIPAWVVLDRGNSVGFIAPIGLVFLVALRRGRWGLVAMMVVVAALVRPQFALFVVALFAARQWRWGGVAVTGVVTSNLLAYLLWPRDFPDTIAHTIRNARLHEMLVSISTVNNISFAKIPDIVGVNRNGALDGQLAPIGYAVLLLVVVCVLVLGRRIPPVMVGMVLLATASLFPPMAWRYYLVFALPIAALVVRDPDGPPGAGIFDGFAALGDRRRAVGVCVTVAGALTIAHIALPQLPLPVPTPGQPAAAVYDAATGLTPLLWLIACAVMIVSYARRPGLSADAHATTAAGQVESVVGPGLALDDRCDISRV